MEDKLRDPKRRPLGDDSERERHAKRRTREVLVVRGISAPKQLMIPPGEFYRIRVDERYQRLEITHMTNDLIHVIKNGGEIYDTATLCERLGEPGVYYIVDGQQRWWASDTCGVPLRAEIFQSTGWEAEAELFEAMNTHVQVGPNVTVKGHQGASATILRDIASTTDSPLYNNVDFGGRARRPYGAFLVMRGMLAAATGIIPAGTAANVCRRADHAIKTDRTAEGRIHRFLQLLPLVFPPTTPLRYLPIIGLGRVSFKRFAGGALVPGPRVHEKLRRLNWPDITDGRNGIKYLVMVEAEIEKIWTGL